MRRRSAINEGFGCIQYLLNAGSMKRFLAVAFLLCSTAHAEQFGAAPRQLTTTIGTPDTVNDGLQTLATIPWTSDADIQRTPFGVSAGRDGLIPLGDYPTVR